MGSERYRLVTRSDFDGLVCAVLLEQLGLVREILFVHPKDVQDGKVEIGPGDITTNLPYAPDAHLVFDHHHSETLRNPTIAANHIIDPHAPSAARVVYVRGPARVSQQRSRQRGGRRPAPRGHHLCREPLHGLRAVPRLHGVGARDLGQAAPEHRDRVGRSILNRTSGADVGALMLSYGGGGHANAGTCQVGHDEADRVVDELVGHLNAATRTTV